MRQRVILVRNVRPDMYGGGETYQLMLARELEKNGFMPIIVTSSDKLLQEARRQKYEAVKCPFIKQQNWSGWRNIVFPIYWCRLSRLKKWYKKLFKKYEPVTVNIQSRDDWLAATGVAKKMGVKVLWTDHMDFRSWVLQNVGVPYKNVIGKMVLKKAKLVEKIIFISDYERRAFEKTVLPRKYNSLVTIKNGVQDRLAEFVWAKPKKGTICYVGRIVDYKGIGELEEAFSRINKIDGDVILNIYGDGEEMEKFRKKAKDNKRIVFHGRTDEPLKVMAENEIFVLPSYREGLSLSLLDAAMMRKTIIASNVDGNPEVVEDGVSGLLVPARNVNRLAEAMEKVLVEPKLAQQLAKGARKKYEQEFNFEKIFLEKMLPLYNKNKEEK